MDKGQTIINRRQAIIKANTLLAGAIIGSNQFVKGLGLPLLQFDKAEQRPDTYFLQKAVIRGLNAIAARLDPEQYFRPFFEIHCSPKPYLEHSIWDLGDMCARFTDAFILGREMTGFDGFKQEEHALNNLLRSCDPYANPFMAGRILIAYVDQYLDKPNDENKKHIDDLVGLISSKMTYEKDYAYYFRHPDGWKTVNDAVFGDYTPYPTFPIGGVILGLSRYTEIADAPQSEDLLNKLCRFVLNVSGTFEADGRFLGHTHSGGILTAAAGIMRWAIRHHNDAAITQMKNVFDWTLKYSSSWGWVPDGLGPDNASCESCSITDTIHLGILIANHLDASYYGIIERFARNQLLENQFRNPEWMLPKTDFANKTKITKALNGSWASWSLPNSLDNSVSVEGCCLGNGIRGCFLVWEHIVSRQNDIVMINMALSRNSPWVEVIGYQPFEGRLDIIIHDAPQLQIRIPEWVGEHELVVSTGGKEVKFTSLPSRYIELKGLKKGDRLRLDYPLRRKQAVEKVSGETYQIRWRGDTVVSMAPVGEKYRLFERHWMENPATPMVRSYCFEKQLGGSVHW
ncbi:MAG TPA: hypothetical protein VIM16_00960 [Mucilaginibacter sp.]|jgi:hypothetical protein